MNDIELLAGGEIQTALSSWSAILISRWIAWAGTVGVGGVLSVVLSGKYVLSQGKCCFEERQVGVHKVHKAELYHSNLMFFRACTVSKSVNLIFNTQ